MIVYGVIYINMDEPELSEITGVYKTKEDAICGLISAAGYSTKNGTLLQYMEPSSDYDDMESLEEIVINIEKLDDDGDIYRIEQLGIA